jgi:hypothetical protein
MADPEFVGNFEVSLKVLDVVTGEEVAGDYIIPLGMTGDRMVEAIDGDGKQIMVLHSKCPHVAISKPYVGPLTAHELWWAKQLPGREFNLCWRFAVKELKK